MASPVTLRMDQRTKRRVARIARRRGITASEAIREAVTAWADRNESQHRPYDMVVDLIGCVRGGDPRRSVDAGRGFARLLQARRKAQA